MAAGDSLRWRTGRTAFHPGTVAASGSDCWRWRWAARYCGRLGLTSHGAATVEIRNMALTADFLHSGGFGILGRRDCSPSPSACRCCCALPDAERRECLAEMLPRFSVVAALSVATIVATGVFSAWAQVTVMGGVDHTLRNNPHRQGGAGSALAAAGRVESAMGAAPAAPRPGVGGTGSGGSCLARRRWAF